ncbi:cytochrome P450 [Pseudonocardia sp. TRM90224]|uniref:cytochrome P450 n=1 Tax=Pseudonocardia sp. TRM90224 TaxID=2812678 RepID=UPI001E296AA9|nr:cytochrome P450 [Pseudonocardia sp. TRM90224]
MDQLPFPTDGGALDVAPRFRELQRTAPVARVRTLTGDTAWLATGYPEVKQLLKEPSLGRSHPDPENAARISDAAVVSGPTGDFETEMQRHRQMRQILTPGFSAKRILMLRERVGERIDAILDGMTEPPVDLHELLGMPLPVMVICELLGVPFEDNPRFRAWSTAMVDVTDGAAARRAEAEFFEYTAELLAVKRANPGEDVLSDLVRAVDEFGMTVDQAAQLARGLLFAGHETTMTRIDLGTLLLIKNPEQKDRLLADPSLVNSAVEEILRMSFGASVVGGIPRYAGTDITVGDVHVQRGDAVLIANGVANLDPRAFDDPDTFDITRSPNTHLSFGHGGHFCVGASLARVELREVFGRLFQRFPTLHLAVDESELPVNHDKITGGVAALPVAW